MPKKKDQNQASLSFAEPLRVSVRGGQPDKEAPLYRCYHCKTHYHTYRDYALHRDFCPGVARGCDCLVCVDTARRAKEGLP